MKETTKKAAPESLLEEEEDPYLKYVMKENTINITCEAGGVINITFQTGKPKDGPP
jgi:hypothetical protein